MSLEDIRAYIMFWTKFSHTALPNQSSFITFQQTYLNTVLYMDGGKFLSRPIEMVMVINENKIFPKNRLRYERWKIVIKEKRGMHPTNMVLFFQGVSSSEKFWNERHRCMLVYEVTFHLISVVACRLFVNEKETNNKYE
jgi:hypothetical protein